jgi:hypothetical protein
MQLHPLTDFGSFERKIIRKENANENDFEESTLFQSFFSF